MFICLVLFVRDLYNSLKVLHFKMMHILPHAVVTIEMFTVNRVADCKAIITNLVHHFFDEIDGLNTLHSIKSNDSVSTSRIRRYWARLLYDHFTIMVNDLTYKALCCTAQYGPLHFITMLFSIVESDTRAVLRLAWPFDMNIKLLL